MVIEVDLSMVPPTLTLVDADDMRSFSVTVSRPDHTFVERWQLLALAGERAQDTQWQADLEAMLMYAESKGWVRAADGAVRAHLEWR